MRYYFVWQGVVYSGSLEAVTTEVNQMGLTGQVAIVGVLAAQMDEQPSSCCQMRTV